MKVDVWADEHLNPAHNRRFNFSKRPGCEIRCAFHTTEDGPLLDQPDVLCILRRPQQQYMSVKHNQ